MFLNRFYFILTISFLICASPKSWAQKQWEAEEICSGKNSKETIENCQKIVDTSKNPEDVARALSKQCIYISAQTSVYGNQKETATPLCDKALALSPSLLTALEARGNAKKNLSNSRYNASAKSTLLTDAGTDFDKMIVLAPNDPRGWVARARLENHLGDLSSGLSDANKAIAVAPDYSPGYLLRGEIHDRLDNNEQALKDYEMALKLSPDKPFRLYQMARLSAKIGNLVKALDYANRAVAQKDDVLGNAFSTRGSVHLQMGQFEKAKDDFRAALNKNEWNKDALAGLENLNGTRVITAAYCRDAGPDPHEIIETCSKSLENSEGADVSIKRAQAYRDTNQFDLAIADMTTAINSDPTWHGYYNERAEIFVAFGKYQQALEDLATSERLYPYKDKQKLDQYNLERANIFFKMGRFEVALEQYNQALAICVDCFVPLLRRAEVNYHIKQFDSALLDINAALAMLGKDAPIAPHVRVVRAAILAAKGETREAIPELEWASTQEYCGFKALFCIEPNEVLKQIRP